MSGLEVYEISEASAKLINKLIHEYDVHEARQIKKEQETCKACLYFKTCKYSYHNTRGNSANWKRPKY